VGPSARWGSRRSQCGAAGPPARIAPRSCPASGGHPPPASPAQRTCHGHHNVVTKGARLKHIIEHGAQHGPRHRQPSHALMMRMVAAVRWAGLLPGELEHTLQEPLAPTSSQGTAHSLGTPGGSRRDAPLRASLPACHQYQFCTPAARTDSEAETLLCIPQSTLNMPARGSVAVLSLTVPHSCSTGMKGDPSEVQDITQHRF
jgi:hypothetical protein